MIKQQIRWATKTVLGLSVVLGVSACAPTTQPWLGRSDLQVPWLGRTHQAPSPQTYQRQVPQAQPYTRQQQSYQQPQYPQRLPEAQPPRYVPLPPDVRPYGNAERPPAPAVRPSRPATPVATTRPLWEEERVRVQNLPAQRPVQQSAQRPAPRAATPNTRTPTPSASSPVSNSTARNTTNNAQNEQDAGNRYMDLAAVQVLTTQANSAVQAEEWGRAGDALERALRIQPDNPRLWLRLGEVYKEQGNKQQAAEMARKAMRIAPGDAYIERRAGLLLK